MDSLQQIVDDIKSDSQTGQIGNNTDRAATDILKDYNNAAIAFWELNNWDWGKTPIAITVPAQSTGLFSMPAAVGQIINLGIVGQAGDLAVFTEHFWRKFKKSQDSTDVNGNIVNVTTNNIYGFVLRGRDASGNLQVLFVEPATSIVQIEGEGKTRLAAVAGLRYQVADIATVLTPNFGYFPEEVMPILYDWALGRYLRNIKDVRGQPMIDAVGQRIQLLKGTQRTEPAERPTTKPPDYQLFVNGKRGGRTVV